MKRKFIALAILGVMAFCLTLCSSSSTSAAGKTLDEIKAEVRAKYGENKSITDGNYDKSLADRKSTRLNSSHAR